MMRRTLNLQANLIAGQEKFELGLDIVPTTWYNTSIQDTTTRQRTMIKIQDATVETLDDSQARPVGSTILTVTFGGHTFQMVADADEVMEALTIHNGGCKPCMTPAP